MMLPQGQRSFERCAELLTAYGDKTHRSTLAKWSSDFGWQQKVKTWDARLISDTYEHAATDELLAHAAMQARQAQLGRTLSALASSGVERALHNNVTPSPLESARLAEVGTRIERLALGETTSRAEVVQTVLRPVVSALLTVFVEANALDEPRERLASFADAAQRVIDSALVTDDSA